MRKIQRIINEELILLLKEYYYNDDFDYYERRDEIINNAFNDFLYKNNEDFTKTMYWPVIPFNSIKKVWEDYMRYGFVRNEKILEKIERIMVNNVIRLDAFTYLHGHTFDNPDDEYEGYIGYFVDEFMKCFRKKYPNAKERQHYHPDQLQFDFDDETGRGYKAGKEQDTVDTRCDDRYEIKYLYEFIDDNNLYNLPDEELREKLMEEMDERFIYYYSTDPKSGHLYISDFGLKPLQELVVKLRNQEKPEDRLVTVDKMLNVVHMRSDLASWFVQGGSSALSNLSGYEHDDEGELLAAKAEKNQQY